MMLDTTKYIPVTKAVERFGVSRQHIIKMGKRRLIRTVNPFDMTKGLLYCVEDMQTLFGTLKTKPRRIEL